MLSNTRTLRIEWGDCDPAGIVFYPRYFAMFDASTTYLMERAIGMAKFDYLKAYDFLGHPIVETRAIFRVPTRYGDEVTIEIGNFKREQLSKLMPEGNGAIRFSRMN